VSASAREPIFDVVERADPSPMKNGESSFRFFNRVSSEFWDQPRSLTQAWADQIPADADYREMRSRLRSPDDYELRSVFLELYLHEVLRRSCRAVEIHPELPTGSRRPDFRTKLDDESIYVEAIAPSISKEAKSAAARLAQFYAVIDSVNDPNFFLWVDEVNQGPDPVAASNLRRRLRGWLAGLIPGTFVKNDRPTFSWTEGEWSGSISVWPRGRELRGDEFDRGIGVYPMVVGFFSDAPTIRRALAEKDSAYGSLDAPYIIAIGINSFDTDHDDIENALWGQDSLIIEDFANGGARTRRLRQPNGYFGSPGGWLHTQVSAVLVVNQLLQHNPMIANVSLWVHPGADHPLPAGLIFPGVTVELVDDILQTTSGIDPHEFFGLPTEWPSGDPWPWKKPKPDGPVTSEDQLSHK
jgi:hypothetical protein